MSVELPEPVLRLAKAWGFEPAEELERGHSARVFADRDRVLKAPWRGEELDSGFRATLLVPRVGGPDVLAADEETGAILMARCTPGTPLGMLDDENEVVSVAAEFALRMRVLPARDMLPLRQFYANDDLLLEHLEATTRERVFLHGDLHPWNVLRDGELWRPIDPKGLVGDPAYECVAFARNRPDDRLGAIESLARATAVEPWRVAAWLIVDRRSDDEFPPSDAEVAALEDTLRRLKP